MNRFWLFLRDEQTHEEHTAHHDILHQYRGAGTGLILSSLVLSHLLATLGVLVHVSQNAPTWLAVVAPDALELAVTLGTRSISRGGEDEDEEESGGGEPGSGEDKDARVLATASRSADEKEKENRRTRWLRCCMSRLPARVAPYQFEKGSSQQELTKAMESLPGGSDGAMRGEGVTRDRRDEGRHVVKGGRVARGETCGE
jgi:hypothetical protein